MYRGLPNTDIRCVSRNLRTGRLERELQIVQLSATRCSFIAILWVSLVSFTAITLCVASQRVIPKVSLYFVIDSVRKLLDTLSYVVLHGCMNTHIHTHTHTQAIGESNTDVIFLSSNCTRATHLITPSRNFVEVRWRSLFRSTSLGKRCISYNAPPTYRKRAADRWSLGNFLPQSSLFMVGKAQKSHGARCGRYEWCSNGVPPIHVFQAVPRKHC
jgi:hypothetical protein